MGQHISSFQDTSLLECPPEGGMELDTGDVFDDGGKPRAEPAASAEKAQTPEISLWIKPNDRRRREEDRILNNDDDKTLC